MTYLTPTVMKKIQVNIKHILNTVSEESVRTLQEGTGEGNDFLGWLDLPSRTPAHHLDEIQAVADELRNSCDYVVSIGIGGSYLGAKAVIEALSNSFDAYTPALPNNPKVLFAGQNI